MTDEIQTGMGRTGTFLACTSMGINPDYVCLFKSLGGGIVKIGALLVKRERYRDEFSILHSSTFAEDDFSCRIALKALEVLDRDDLPARALSIGGYFMVRLELRLRFPNEIREVRGRGLMIGWNCKTSPTRARTRSACFPLSSTLDTLPPSIY